MLEIAALCSCGSRPSSFVENCVILINYKHEGSIHKFMSPAETFFLFSTVLILVNYLIAVDDEWPATPVLVSTCYIWLIM